MKFTYLLSAAWYFAFVAAIDLEDFPDCGVTCFIAAHTYSGAYSTCAITDGACVCNYPNFISQYQTVCVPAGGFCTDATESQESLDIIVDYCNQYPAATKVKRWGKVWKA